MLTGYHIRCLGGAGRWPWTYLVPSTLAFDRCYSVAEGEWGEVAHHRQVDLVPYHSRKRPMSAQAFIPHNLLWSSSTTTPLNPQYPVSTVIARFRDMSNKTSSGMTCITCHSPSIIECTSPGILRLGSFAQWYSMSCSDLLTTGPVESHTWF